MYMQGRRRWVGRAGNCPPRFWEICNPNINQMQGADCDLHITKCLPNHLSVASYVPECSYFVFNSFVLLKKGIIVYIFSQKTRTTSVLILYSRMIILSK